MSSTRGRGRGGKPTSQTDLDAQLDAYMLKDTDYAKTKLDGDLDSYFATVVDDDVEMMGDGTELEGLQAEVDAMVPDEEL